MEIAVMGAGLSGLACAITLERNGVRPVIFESRREVGDRFVNAEVLFSFLVRPITDCIAYLSEHHGIYLKPASSIQKLVVYAERSKMEMDAFLGFTNVRGRHRYSFEKQLREQVRASIHFNSTWTYDQLVRHFSHVVLATGDAKYAGKLGNFREDLTVSFKGATVEGDFDRTSVCIWFNHDFAPKGNGYLIPFSEKEANLAIAFPDYPENRLQNVDALWDKFFQRVLRDTGSGLKITDQFQTQGYPIGICRNPRIGNTFFVGNCFGTIMPFLGFGQLPSILTGIYAAEDLCGKGSYAEKTEVFRKSYGNSLVLRKLLERQGNLQLDRIVRLLNRSWAKKLLFSNRWNSVEAVALLSRPWIQLAGKKQADAD